VSVTKVTKVFSDEYIDSLFKLVDKSVISDDTRLGRSISILPNLINFNTELKTILKELKLEDLSVSSVTYVEYNNKYGKPNLPPHYDGDFNELIINYQLESNTSWDVGVDKNVYSTEDNSALIFNPNKHIHWRPIKNFSDGEYLKMLFFRLCNEDESKRNDYSELMLSMDHEAFKEINDFRDELFIEESSETL
jgi:hypothetical protein